MKALTLWTLLASILIGIAHADLLTLTNKDGRTIKATLISRGEESAKVMMNKKVFTVKYDQLENESVQKIKTAEIKPQLSDELELDIQIKKTSEKIKSSIPVILSNGNTDNQQTSFRIDTVFGEVKIKNKHNILRSKNGMVKIVILGRTGSSIRPMHSQTFQFSNLAPLDGQEFKVSPSTTAHTPKGGASLSGAPANGRYYGYVAAIYVDGVQTGLKSVPASLQKDPEKAARYLR